MSLKEKAREINKSVAALFIALKKKETHTQRDYGNK